MIKTEHIKEIQMILGDDTLGDYVRLIISNPDNRYIPDKLGFLRYKLKAGYDDTLLDMFKGYSIIAKSERYTLPNEMEILLHNRFYMLGRLVLGSTDFIGKTGWEVLDWIINTLNLSPNEVVIEDISQPFLDVKIPPYQDTSISYLQFIQNFAEAFNLWIWWDYEGKLRIRRKHIPTSSSFEITKDKCTIKEDIRPFRRATKIEVLGRSLQYWEQTAPIQTIGYYPEKALDHTKFGDQISYITSQAFELVYQTKPAWATEIILSPNWASCQGPSGQISGDLYEVFFVNIETDKCLIDIRVKNVPLYECCLKSKNLNVYKQIYFNLDLRGYRISTDERFARVYVEYTDTELEKEYGGKVVKRIDNELIPNHIKANIILDYEKELNKYVGNEVEIEIPLNPLIERFDRISVKNEFDVFVHSIEHTYQPGAGKSKTILKGYKL